MPPPRVPDLVSSLPSPLPFLIHFAPASGSHSPSCVLLEGRWERNVFVDLSRQCLGQNPKEGALEGNGLWEMLAFTPPQRAVI